MSLKSPLRRTALLERLGTSRFAREVEVLGIVTSTSDLVIAKGRAGAPDGALIVAEGQYGGRGRQGGQWTSPVRRGLWFSFLLRPTPAPALATTPAVAVGLAKALEKHGAAARIKWPNDLLVQGGKIGGTLVDVTTDAEGQSFAVCGVGINVDVQAHEVPSPGVAPPTSFSAAGLSLPAREALLADALLSVEAELLALERGELDALRQEYVRRDALRGCQVVVEGPEGPVTGRLERCDPIDGLDVITATGTVHVPAEHARILRVDSDPS